MASWEVWKENAPSDDVEETRTLAVGDVGVGVERGLICGLLGGGELDVGKIVDHVVDLAILHRRDIINVRFMPGGKSEPPLQPLAIQHSLNLGHLRLIGLGGGRRLSGRKGRSGLDGGEERVALGSGDLVEVVLLLDVRVEELLVFGRQRIGLEVLHLVGDGGGAGIVTTACFSNSTIC